MTIIDQYILDNYKSKDAIKMSAELGLNYRYVRDKITRVRRQNDLSRVKTTVNIADEIIALNRLISTRVSGWAVEIAKDRIRRLERISDF